MCNFYWDSAILQRTLEDITQWKNHVFISLVTLTISSVQSFSRIQLFVTHGLKYARLPCLSPTPRAYLSFPSPPAFNLSQHQGLFQWVSSLRQVAKGLEFQLQHQSFQMNIQEWFHLGLTGWVFLPSKRFKNFLQDHSSKASTLTMNNLKLMGSLLWFTERGGWGGQDNSSWWCYC